MQPLSRGNFCFLLCIVLFILHHGDVTCSCKASQKEGGQKRPNMVKPFASLDLSQRRENYLKRRRLPERHRVRANQMFSYVLYSNTAHNPTNHTICCGCKSAHIIPKWNAMDRKSNAAASNRKYKILPVSRFWVSAAFFSFCDLKQKLLRHKQKQIHICTSVVGGSAQVRGQRTGSIWVWFRQRCNSLQWDQVEGWRKGKTWGNLAAVSLPVVTQGVTLLFHKSHRKPAKLLLLHEK